MFLNNYIFNFYSGTCSCNPKQASHWMLCVVSNKLWMLCFYSQKCFHCLHSTARRYKVLFKEDVYVQHYLLVERSSQLMEQVKIPNSNGFASNAFLLATVQ